MVDRVTPFRDIHADSGHAFEQLKKDIDGLVSELDFQRLSQRVQEFGRENPVMLATVALSLGIAAGLLMKRGDTEGA